MRQLKRKKENEENISTEQNLNQGTEMAKSPVVLVQLISQFFNRLIVVQLNSENKLSNVQTSREVFGNVLSKTASLSLPAVNSRTMMKMPIRIDDK